jgi:hypothetical protein
MKKISAAWRVQKNRLKKNISEAKSVQFENDDEKLVFNNIMLYYVTLHYVFMYLDN